MRSSKLRIGRIWLPGIALVLVSSTGLASVILIDSIGTNVQFYSGLGCVVGIVLGVAFAWGEDETERAVREWDDENERAVRKWWEYQLCWSSDFEEREGREPEREDVVRFLRFHGRDDDADFLEGSGKYENEID